MWRVPGEAAGRKPGPSNPVRALARLLQLLLTLFLVLPPHLPFLPSPANVHEGGLHFTTGRSRPGHTRCRRAGTRRGSVVAASTPSDKGGRLGLLVLCPLPILNLG